MRIIKVLVLFIIATIVLPCSFAGNDVQSDPLTDSAFLNSILGNLNITDEQFDRLVKIAETGHTGAMRNLGWRYLSNNDFSKAREWHEKMYDAGGEFGAYAIGLMYQRGEGVPVNFSKAYEWFSKVKTPETELMWATVAIVELYEKKLS